MKGRVTTMLYGRNDLTAAIGLALENAGDGHGSAHLLRGEAGIGKSAVLRDTIDRAGDFTVVQATCRESEAEFGFAVLDQLVRPILHHVAGIPALQRQALEGALGLAHLAAPDPFLVSAAFLSLLAEAAEDRPLLCVVDDAQWCDKPSWDALLFVARRLKTDSIVLLLSALGDEEPTLDTDGIVTTVLDRLSDDDAERLVRERLAPASPAQVDGIVHWGQGNPLALLEAVAAHHATEPRAQDAFSGQIPISDALRRKFQCDLGRLSAEAQVVALVAAIDPRETVDNVVECASRVGAIDPKELLEEVVAADLVEVSNDHVAFRHPLVRAAVVQGASVEDRRSVHRAFAQLLAGTPHLDRFAWHMMNAYTAPNDAVAAALEAAARTATERGAHEPASWALARAADFSESDAGKARRLTMAAEAAWAAGMGGVAKDFSARASRMSADPEIRARLDHLTATIELRSGVPIKAYATLRSLADRAAETSPRRAASILLAAVEAAWLAGHQDLVVSAGDRARELLGDTPTAEDLPALVAAGFTQAVFGDVTEGRRLCEAATDIAVASSSGPEDLLVGAMAAGFAGRIATRYALAADALSMCQAEGRASLLPLVHEHVAAAETHLGLLSNARATATAGVALARELKQETVLAHLLPRLAVIDAMTGDRERCEAHATEALSIAARLGLKLWETGAHMALGIMDLLDGRTTEAAERLAHVVRGQAGGDPYMALLVTPDAIEAAIRAGDRALAEEALDTYRRFAEGGPDWVLALHARCEALVASPEDAEAWYERALSYHKADGRTVERARTQLLYGEHLRRLRRRVDARSLLRLAAETFERQGCRPWFERTQVELRATGETTRGRGQSSSTAVTPQEFQISRLVAAGLSNREIAAQLFISPRTVEYHLGKLYPKLQISTRSKLTELFHQGLLNSSS